MTTEDKDSFKPHTAITTWSGFIYQGKVALYHVLFLLNNSNNCDEYILQLDSLEDFSVLDGTGGIVSLHQVKALKTQYYNNYKEAFEKLKINSEKYGCSTAKFHLANKITDKTDEAIYDSHAPVEIYKYNADSYCSVDEIDHKIEELIKGLMAIYFIGDPSKQSTKYLSKARSVIDQLVLKKVLMIHKMVHEKLMSDREAAYSQTIQFSEIIDCLNKDLNQEDLGEDYYFYVLLSYFHEYYQGYCIDHEELNVDQLKKLSLYMMEISSFGKSEMIQFVRNIMPHRVFKFETLEDFKDCSFEKAGIQECFLTILNELKQTGFSSNKFIQWKAGDGRFSPTTIDKGMSQADNVCMNIIKNAKNTDLDIMYEGSHLITTDINVDSITNNVSGLIQGVESRGREDARISRWKKVSLVSLKDAKDVIND